MAPWKVYTFFSAGLAGVMAVSIVALVKLLNAEPLAAIGVVAAVVVPIAAVVLPKLLEQKKTAELTVVGGVSRGQSFVLIAGQKVGRSRNAEHLVPADDWMSNPHARFDWHRGEWVISDLASLNGTFVNGRKIDKPTPVLPKDEITIGMTKFRITPTG